MASVSQPRCHWRQHEQPLESTWPTKAAAELLQGGFRFDIEFEGPKKDALLRSLFRPNRQRSTTMVCFARCQPRPVSKWVRQQHLTQIPAELAFQFRAEAVVRDPTRSGDLLRVARNIFGGVTRSDRRVSGITVPNGGRLLGAVEEGIDPSQAREGIRASEDLSFRAGGLQRAV